MSLYEVIDSRTHVHLIMELCRGTNLFHIIKKRKPQPRLSESEAATIFKKVVSAVEYMHSNEMVHRDLKLDNILVFEDQVKLIDLGFATGCTKDEKLNIICGTPQYMDPDLAKKGWHHGQAADVWALGVILYILVTGKTPFSGGFEADLYRNIIKGKFSWPDDLREKDGSRFIPSPELKGLVRKILEPNV